MPLNIIVGTQWGDEGKGRIVDLFSANADVVARYSGGDNAGHTVTVGDEIFKLHLIPSGIVHTHTVCVLGSGMVINLAALQTEINTLREAGIPVRPDRLAISAAAHLITPFHRQLDQAQDEARGSGKIGTTGRGIGPAYVDKAARSGMRVRDILQPDELRRKLQEHIAAVDAQMKAFYHSELHDVDVLLEKYMQTATMLAPYVQDTATMVRTALKENKTVVAEGAQGTLLDIDQGTYPFVTSSTTTAAGVFAGLGLGITPVNRVIGVTKAFQTRVGSGPFPTEESEATAVRLRGTGANPWDEFGTTTGRPRRVGWLDAVLLRYAASVNGLTELVLTKMDILSGFDKIKICTAYKMGRKTFDLPPYGVDGAQLGLTQPVYQELDGWREDITAMRTTEELPDAARGYVRALEDAVGLPVKLVSVGPERDQIIPF
ncbi:MAG: adenylosuccinate synthase [Anaerolineaceae bacterium]